MDHILLRDLPLKTKNLLAVAKIPSVLGKNILGWLTQCVGPKPPDPSQMIFELQGKLRLRTHFLESTFGGGNTLLGPTF